MNIKNIFKKLKNNNIHENFHSQEGTLIGATITHCQLSAPEQFLAVDEIIMSEGTIKRVKKNGNLIVDTVSLSGNHEVGEYRKVNGSEKCYSRIDRPGNPLNEQVFF